MHFEWCYDSVVFVIPPVKERPFHACSIQSIVWGAVGLWLEHRTLNQESPGSNLLTAVSKLGQFRSLHVASVHSAV